MFLSLIVSIKESKEGIESHCGTGLELELETFQ